MQKIVYNTQEFPFKDKLCNFFGVDNLSTLNENIDLLTRINDQKTQWHPIYYSWAKTEEFKHLYTNFISKIIKPIYNESIVYQSIPTFRIAYPNNIAVGEFHKDKFYRDSGWASKIKEDNYYLPFTKAYDTNTIWAESEEDKGDFSPINCDYGECIKWDGANLMHGNKINHTGETRVSVDFRIIKYSNYVPSTKSSINTNIQFKIGGYYTFM